MLKVVLVVAVLRTASAQVQEESQQPHLFPRYEFSYLVDDPHTNDRKFQFERRNGGVTKGIYSVLDSDGTIRKVEYSSDKYKGFNAQVTRTGTSKHPDGHLAKHVPADRAFGRVQVDAPSMSMLEDMTRMSSSRPAISKQYQFLASSPPSSSSSSSSAPEEAPAPSAGMQQDEPEPAMQRSEPPAQAPASPPVHFKLVGFLVYKIPILTQNKHMHQSGQESIPPQSSEQMSAETPSPPEMNLQGAMSSEDSNKSTVNAADTSSEEPVPNGSSSTSPQTAKLDENVPEGTSNQPNSPEETPSPVNSIDSQGATEEDSSSEMDITPEMVASEPETSPYDDFNKQFFIFHKTLQQSFAHKETFGAFSRKPVDKIVQYVVSNNPIPNKVSRLHFTLKSKGDEKPGHKITVYKTTREYFLPVEDMQKNPPFTPGGATL